MYRSFSSAQEKGTTIIQEVKNSNLKLEIVDLIINVIEY